MYLKVDEYETYYQMRYVGYRGVLLTSIASLVSCRTRFEGFKSVLNMRA